MKILKDLFLEKREKAGLSRKEVAKKLNITTDGYSKIERGDKNPSLKTFSRLAAVLDIDMNILKKSAMEELR